MVQARSEEPHGIPPPRRAAPTQHMAGDNEFDIATPHRRGALPGSLS
jgi:hypothetical protein